VRLRDYTAGSQRGPKRRFNRGERSRAIQRSRPVATRRCGWQGRFGDEYDGRRPSLRSSIVRIFRCPQKLGVTRLISWLSCTPNSRNPAAHISSATTDQCGQKRNRSWPFRESAGPSFARVHNTNGWNSEFFCCNQEEPAASGLLPLPATIAMTLLSNVWIPAQRLGFLGARGRSRNSVAWMRQLSPCRQGVAKPLIKFASPGSSARGAVMSRPITRGR